MHEQNPIKGFSKLSRDEKVKWLSEYISEKDLAVFLQSFRMLDEENQTKFESFSENTLSNYHLPWGLVPNVLIDGTLFHVPVVIEESSVVAAASKAASFWAQRGGFRTLHISTRKKGQLHFTFNGNGEVLKKQWGAIAQQIKSGVRHLTQNMEQRGGGITGIQLKQIPGLPSEYYQLDLEAETMDSMGANFINSILEEAGRLLPDLIFGKIGNGQVEIIMGILSNYTPESMVKLQIQAPVNELTWAKDMAPEKFVRLMQWAADIAWYDTGRAVTHNKGIYNGVDAVVLATGNDFRAVEAAGHAYAAKDGKYRALSRVFLENDIFSLELEIPMALGTVGGLTKLHPLAAKTLQVMGEPDARTLMKIAAAIGLANNFAAMASLVTTGIQQGHMKMHLHNILNSLNVKPEHYPKVEEYFSDKTISVSAVGQFISKLK